MTLIPRTVLNGVPQSVTTAAKLPTTAAQGAVCMAEDTGQVYIYDVASQTWLSVGAPYGSVANQAALPVSATDGQLCKVQDLDTLFMYDTTNGWQPVGYLAFKYDCAVHGGAIGDISLGITVPANTLIVGGILDVVASVTFGTSGTLALKLEGAGDILAATNATGLTAGLKDIVPVGTAATTIKTTQTRTVKATVAVAAATAGKFYGFLTTRRSFGS